MNCEGLYYKLLTIHERIKIMKKYKMLPPPSIFSQFHTPHLFIVASSVLTSILSF